MPHQCILRIAWVDSDGLRNRNLAFFRNFGLPTYTINETLNDLRCRSSVKMYYTNVGETPTADAPFLIDIWGKSETMF